MTNVRVVAHLLRAVSQSGIGTRVQLTGLSGATHLNGKEGFVRCFDTSGVNGNRLTDFLCGIAAGPGEGDNTYNNLGDFLRANTSRDLRYIVRLADGKEVRVKEANCKQIREDRVRLTGLREGRVTAGHLLNGREGVVMPRPSPNNHSSDPAEVIVRLADGHEVSVRPENCHHI